MVFFSGKYVTNMRTEKNNFYRFISAIEFIKADTIAISEMTRREIIFREPL
jgi:hypothetical protein